VNADERIAELRAELEKGRDELARLDARRAEIRDTMLRISGAIQVLEELAQEQPRRPVSAVAP
jgi:prefoldin subunit 5